MLRVLQETRLFEVRAEMAIREALEAINRNRKGIVVVVDAQHRVCQTLTDGDLRRAVLAGATASDGLERALLGKTRSPVTANYADGEAVWLRLMREHSVRHLPLLDAEDRFSALAILDSLADVKVGQAVIMAGGFGRRLYPLTAETPKPMLPVGDRPLMEHTIERLRGAGIGEVVVSTHFAAEKITQHFGDGQSFGVRMDYVREDEPLGTAGALRLLADPPERLLVVNGDILTELDFQAMAEFHVAQAAELTVGVRQIGLEVPYGVVRSEAGYVRGIEEKPRVDFLVNAGIYLLESKVLEFIPEKQFFNMTDLISALVAAERKVASFPILEYWLDIGRPGDYDRAQKEIKGGLEQ